MVDLEGLCEACGKAGQRCCPDNSGGGKRTVCASGLRCSANESCGPCAGADEILVNGSCVPQPKTIFFVDKPVKNSELGSIESENFQGIAESDSYSYWTSQSLIQRVPKPNLVGDVDRAAGDPLRVDLGRV